MNKTLLTSAIAAALPTSSFASWQTLSSVELTQSQYIFGAGENKPIELKRSESIDSTEHQLKSLNDDQLIIKKGSQISQLVIIDRSVQDASVFSKNLAAGSQVVYIEAGQNGSTQLIKLLADYSDLDAIHIISHGSSGSLQLGNSLFDLNQLTPELFSALNQASKSGADLLLFGCDLAATAEGEHFLNILKQNTHLDIAASTDKTGNPAQGGDWELELVKGNIEITRPFSAAALKDFSALLATLDYSAQSSIGPVADYTLSASLSSNIDFTIDWGTGTEGNNLYTDHPVQLVGGIAIAPYDNSFPGIFNNSSGGLQITADSSFALDAMRLYRRGSGGGTEDFTVTGFKNDVQVVSDTLTWTVLTTNGEETFTRGSGTWADDDAWLDIDKVVVSWPTALDSEGEIYGTAAFQELAVVNVIVSDATVSDSTAPTFENTTPSASNIDTFGFQLNVDISEVGTIYYVVTESGDSTPSAAQVQAGQNSSGTSALASGSQYVSSGGYAHTFDITGLSANTSYKVHVVAKDGSSNVSSVQTSSVSTVATPTIEFATSSDLDNYFDDSYTGSNPVIFSSTGGINDSGHLVANTLTATQLLTFSSPFSPTLSSWNVSFFAKDQYGIRFGFTDASAPKNSAGLPTNDAVTEYRPNLSIALGGTGGGTIGYYNKDILTSLQTNLNFSREWYYYDLAVSYLGSSQYSIRVRIYAASASGLLDSNTPLVDKSFNATSIELASADNAYLFIGFNDQVDSVDKFYTSTYIANNTPDITVSSNTLVYTEGNISQIAPSAIVTDTDGDADWDGGTFKVQITENAESGDEISISDTDGDGTAITISGTDILSNSVDIGDLSVSGGTVTNNTALTITFDSDATNANVQEVLQSIRYRTTSDNPGTSNRTVTFTATDKNAASASDTRTIAVSAVNDNPEITSLPDDLTVTEDSSGNLDLSAVVLSDSDSGTITVTLTLSGGSFATPADGSGVGSGVTETLVNSTTITLVGSADDINTYLDTASNIQYTGSSNTNGDNAATLNISVNDGDGSGDVNLGSANIDITAVNDAPTVSTNAGLTLDEAASSQISSAELAASDVDDVASGITFTVATLPANGSLKLNDSVLTVNSTFTQADIDNNLVSYEHNGGESTADSFEFSVADGGEDSAAAVTGQTFSITVNPVNDAPSVATNSGLTLNEGANSQITTTELNASDADDSGTGLTYTITTAPTNGTLFVDANSNSTLDSGEELAVNGTFTQQDIEALNNGGLRYEHDGGETTSDNFEFDLADGGEDSAAAVTGQTFSITVNPVNDAPTVNTNTGLTTSDISEGGSASITQAKFEYTDADDAAANLTYTITTLPTNGTLTLNDTTLNVNDTFTQDDINNELVKYIHNGTDNLTDSFTFDLKDDEDAGVTGQTFSISVTNVNDNPTGTSLPSDISFTEDSNGNLDLSQIVFADSDSGASITVTLTLNGGTFSSPADGSAGNVTATLVNSTTITLVGTPADINAYLDTASNIQYTGSSNTNGDNAATLNISVNDNAGSGDITVGDINLDITAVNDAPSMATNSGLTLDEGGNSQISTSELSASDVDDSGAGLIYTITTAPGNGTLFVDANDNGTLDTGEALAANSTFTQQDIEALNNGGLRYEHNGGETTSDSFVFNLADGGEDSAAAVTGQTFSITVNPVNDSPSAIQLSTSQINQSQALDSAFVIGILSTSDEDAADTHSYSLVEVASSDNGNCTSAANNSLFAVENDTLKANAGILPGNYQVCIATNDGTTNYQQTFAINVVDDVAPDAPSITTPIETDGVVNAAEDNDVLIAGTGAEAGNSVTITITDGANSSDQTVTADGSGAWTINGSEFDVSSFNNGSLTVSVTQTDTAGNTSDPASTTITLDNQAPAAPSISTPIEIDNIVNASEDDTVLISGSGAEPNASLTITVGSVSIQTTADSNGDWTIESNELDISALNNGSLTVTVTQTDAAGNESSSATQGITLDNTAPDAPVINTPIESDGIVNAAEDEDVLIAGTGAEAGNNVTVTITDGANSSDQTVTADGSGNWTINGSEFDVSSFNNGSLTVSVTQTDTAGNTSSAATQSITLDNSDPTAPTITTPVEGDGYVNAAEDNDVLIAGSGAEANASVTVTITDGANSLDQTVTADGSGNWTASGSEFDVSSFTNGSLTVTATQTDAAGNTSSAATQSITLDNSTPSAVTITTPIETDGIVNAAEDEDVLIAGTGAEAGNSVTITITDGANSSDQTVTADGSGAWTINGSEFDVSSFNNGSLTVSVTQTDTAGNTSDAASTTITLDNQAPAAPSISTPIEIDNIVNASEDDTVLISGSGAEPNASLTITVGSVSIQTTADSSGNWTIESNELDISALNNGSLTVTVTQTDAAGNESSSATQDITLDNSAPSAPSITTPIEGDGLVNAAEDNDVLIAGTGAEAGNNVTVTITDGANSSDQTVTADGSGNWTASGSEFDVSSFTNGSLTVSVTQTDTAGNTSAAATQNITLDNSTPGAVTIITPIEVDGLVNAAEDENVLIAGSGAEANASVTVTITDGANSLDQTVTADGSGNWTVSGSEFDVSAFNNGTLTVTATQTDAAGNTSTASTQDITLDNSAPSEVTITTPIETDGIVNAAEDTDVLIAGSGAEANASVTVTITDGVNSLDQTVTADGSGDWTISSSEFDVSAFNNGTLTVSVTQTDTAGNTSDPASTTITLDNQAPAAPSISTPIEIDNIVNAGEDDTVLISGCGAEANATLTITVGSVSIQTTADSNGDWTIESNELDISALNNGSLTVTVTQTDAAGNESSSATQGITLDNTAPDAPVINTPIESDGIVNAAEDADVLITGSGAEANASVTVTITDGVNSLDQTVTADGSGNWTASGSEFDVSSFTNGSLTVSVTQTDTAGNTSAAATQNITLDNSTPGAVTIITPIEGDGLVNAAEDNDVLIAGSGAEAGNSVTVTITDGANSSDQTVTADGSGNWTINGSEFDVSAFNNGTLTVTATQTDAAGNTSTASTQDITLDNSAPSEVTITTPIETDGIVNAAEDTDVLIAGSGAEANASVTVTITDGVNSLDQTVTADGSGAWTINGSEFDVSSFNNGSLTVSVTQTDTAGNTSDPASTTITLDNQAPAAPSISTPIEIDNIVNASEDDTVLISGSGAEPNASLTITVGSVLIQTTADSNGDWTIESNELDISALNNGSLTVTVTQTDAAGNESSSATQDITLDNSAPSAPSITTPIEGDGLVNAAEDADVLITGSGAEANASVTVTITDGVNSLDQTVTADGSGNWTASGSEFDVSSFTNGSLTVSATQTDAAGNTSSAATQSIILDNSAPTAPTITTPVEGDGYVNAAEDNDVLIAGSGAEANASVTVTITDGANSLDQTVTADGSGNWTVSGSEFDVSAFNNGTLTVTATQTDAAGNTSTASTQDITLDNSAPSAVTITTPIETDGIVNAAEDADVLIAGSGAEANASVTVTVTDGVNSLDQTVTADGSGDWTISGSELDVSAFNNGTLTISATQTDTAGNTSTAATEAITLDNSAPSAPSITTPIEIDNIVNAGEDDTVLISGSGAEANATLTITIGSVSIQTTADSNGDWTIESNELDISALTNGTLTVTVIQTDAAGNESSSATQGITLDNTAPDAPVINTPIEGDDVINANEALNLILAGTSEPMADIEVIITDSDSGSFEIQTSADESGEWVTDSADLSSLIDGELNITTVQTDQAGNMSEQSQLQVMKDTLAPKVSTISLSDGNFKAGETIVFTLTSDKAISVSGDNLSLSLDIGGVDKQAEFVSATENSLTFHYTVQAGDTDDDGVVVLASGVILNSDIIEDAAGNIADLTFTNEQNVATLVDTTAPVQVVINEPAEPVTVNASSFVISGTHPEAIKVKLYADVDNNGQPDSSEALLSTGVVEGSWSFEVNLTENTEHNFVIQAEDDAGNVSGFTPVSTITEDSTSPADFEVVIEQSLIDLTNDTSASFALNGAEVGSQYQYIITDSNKQTVSGFGTVNQANQLVDGIDVSGLAEGELTITVILSDDANNQSNSFSDTVNKLYQKAPVIIQGEAVVVSMSEDSSPVAFALSLDATDENGDELTWTVSSNASSGTAQTTASGNTANISYTPDDNFNGSDSFVIQVSDGVDSDTVAVNVTVDAVNDEPTGQSMQVSVVEDSSAVIIPATDDLDGDTLSLQVKQLPQNGVLTTQNDGWIYQPELNFNGSDRFVYTVSDDTAESVEYSVELTVTPVNDAPVAQADAFNLEKSDDDSYSLNVLANDLDVDGDTLIIEGVSASVGEATISDSRDTINYQAPDNFTGRVTLNYSVRDGNKGRSQALVNLQITGVQFGEPPVISVPDDVVVNATGLFTKVDLGVATAVDALGNPLPVSLVDGSTLFKPGEHIAYWRAVDSQGNETTEQQTVTVHPLVSISKNQIVSEGSDVTVTFLLNGPAPQYPLTIPFSVNEASTADVGIDYDLSQTSVDIESGTQAKLTFSLLADAEVEPDETIIIDLDSSLNLGAKNTTSIRISEDNIAPEVGLTVMQDDENRLTVSQQTGLVSIMAAVSDPNPNDTVSINWTTQDDIVNLSADAQVFEFDPLVVNPGVYPVSAIVTDSGLPALSDSQTVYIEVRESLQQLDENLDTDGDLIPDAEEGYADSDGDGIPDFQDAISDCNVVPEQALIQNGFLVEGDPGVCLRKGSTAALSDTGGLLLDEDLINAGLTHDDDANLVGGLIDFIAYGLPEKGQSYQLVYPQIAPVPQNAVYRKLRNGNWSDFVVNDSNQIASSLGEPGYCPPPGDESWIAGLTEGHWCVQLTIEDGGSNDDDGIANGSIVDPGGIAVMNNGNQPPVAMDDQAELAWNTSVTIDVLNNDIDPDGDEITVSSVTASFGQIVVEADNQVTYTPNPNYAGNDTIEYGISDRNGGTDSAIVNVTVKPNRSPEAVSDLLQIDGSSPVTINVLANDNDIDGDILSIESASAQYGSVSIVNNQLVYSADDFIGEDTISYLISDGEGGQASSQVTVTITGPEQVTVNNKSSGGSLGVWSLLGLLFTALSRKKLSAIFKRQQKGQK